MLSMNKESLSGLVLSGDDLEASDLFSRMNTLNMYHHLMHSKHDQVKLLLGAASAKKAEEKLVNAIKTAEMFHSFLIENSIALDEVKSNTKALVFGRLAEGMSLAEEYFTKEDPIRDIMIQLIPFFMSTISEKAYIDSARTGHVGVLRSHSIHIYSALYNYIKEYRKISDEEEMKEIGETMKKLYEAMDTNAQEEHGLLLFLLLYLVIYNLMIKEVLNTINQLIPSMKEEV